MHAKRAHANKSQGIKTYTRNKRQIIVIQYLLDELMLTMNHSQVKVACKQILLKALLEKDWRQGLPTCRTQ
jgi:hypothetical protein